MVDLSALLLDLGSVLVRVDIDDIDDLARRVGQDRGVLLEVLVGDYGTDGDHPFHRAERGELTLSEALELIEPDANARGFSLDAIVPMLLEPHIEVNEPLVAEVRRVRAAGVRTGMITNSVIEWIDRVDEALPYDELFDVVIDSCRVGLRKPDPRIFRLALDRLGVDPDRVLFVDDQPGNVAAATDLGMGTIEATDFDEIAAEVRRIAAD